MDKNLLLVLVENRIHGCEHERTMSIATLNTEGTAPINRSLILHCLKTIRPRKSSRSKVKGSFQFWKNKKKKKSLFDNRPRSFLSSLFIFPFIVHISERSRKKDRCMLRSKSISKLKKVNGNDFQRASNHPILSFLNRNEKSKLRLSKFDKNFVRFSKCGRNKKMETLLYR